MREAIDWNQSFDWGKHGMLPTAELLKTLADLRHPVRVGTAENVGGCGILGPLVEISDGTYMVCHHLPSGEPWGGENYTTFRAETVANRSALHTRQHDGTTIARMRFQLR